MRWKPTLGALLFIAATPVAVFELLSPVGSMVVVLVGVGAGLLLVPGFWRSSLHGAIGGVAAGLLVLGPGLRIAMRVVAILDPVRSPEFTVGGTMLIIIGVGVVMGGIFGVIGNVAHGGFGILSGAAGLVPALLVMSMIGLDSELRKRDRRARGRALAQSSGRVWSDAELDSRRGPRYWQSSHRRTPTQPDRNLPLLCPLETKMQDHPKTGP